MGTLRYLLIILLIGSATGSIGMAKPPGKIGRPDNAVVRVAFEQMKSGILEERKKGAAVIAAQADLPVADLLAALKSDNLYLRQGCSQLLADFAPADRIDLTTRLKLATQITSANDPTVTANLAALLYRIGARSVLPDALRYLSQVPAEKLDLAVAIRLVQYAQLGDNTTLPVLEKLLDQQPDRRLALATRVTLVTLGSRPHEMELLTRLYAEPFVETKIEIILAFAQTGAIGADLAAAVYLNDTSEPLRKASLRALKQSGSPTAARLLASHVANGSRRDERELALNALSAISPNPTGLLVEQWQRASRAPQIPRLIEAVATFPAEQSVPILLAMLERHKNQPTAAMPTWGYTVQRFLQQTSGQRFGKELYSEPAVRRDAIIAAWKQWWSRAAEKKNEIR